LLGIWIYADFAVAPISGFGQKGQASYWQE
jgi:hypothetical protein